MWGGSFGRVRRIRRIDRTRGERARGGPRSGGDGHLWGGWEVKCVLSCEGNFWAVCVFRAGLRARGGPQVSFFVNGKYPGIRGSRSGVGRIFGWVVVGGGRKKGWEFVREGSWMVKFESSKLVFQIGGWIGHMRKGAKVGWGFCR